MKRIIYLFALGLLSNHCLFAQYIAPPKSGVAPTATSLSTANIKFSKLIHDYGTIPQGSNGRCQFQFTNTGTGPLILTVCQANCGCVTPNCPRDPILPGKTSIINVNYNTQRVGVIKKTISVTSNATSGTVVLTLKGNVLAAPLQPAFPAAPGNGGPKS